MVGVIIANTKRDLTFTETFWHVTTCWRITCTGLASIQKLIPRAFPLKAHSHPHSPIRFSQPRRPRHEKRRALRAQGERIGLWERARELFHPIPAFLSSRFRSFSSYSKPQDPWINGTHVITIGSGPKIIKEELKSLVREPRKDFFTTDDDPAQNVVQRMLDLAQQDCNGR